MTGAVVIDAVRIPVGRIGGGLSCVRPDDLGASVIKEVVARTDLPGADIEDVYLGCANQAGEGAHGVQPKARICGAAVAGVAPRAMGLGPVPATTKLLDRLGWSLGGRSSY